MTEAVPKVKPFAALVVSWFGGCGAAAPPCAAAAAHPPEANQATARMTFLIGVRLENLVGSGLFVLIRVHSRLNNQMEIAEITLRQRPRLPEWLRVRLPTSD